jgi:hypothetical protein
MGTSSEQRDDIADTLARAIEQAVPDAGGPIHVLGSTVTPAGATDYEVSASRLIPLDSEDPALADVFVPLPVTGHVSLAADGTIDANLPPPDADVAREVQAWARTLVASGSLAGVAPAAPSYGPPTRPTHEIVEDVNGRRVIRRIGYVFF